MQKTDPQGLDRDDLEAPLTKIFGPLDARLLAEITGKLEIVDVPGGFPLFHQGDPGDSLFILLRGRLNVLQRDPESEEERVLGETAPGESVGEIGLLTGEPRSASLWATRDSRLVRISREAFDDLAEDHPELLRGLANVVIDLLRKRTSVDRHGPNVSNVAIIPARAKNGTTRFSEELRSVLARSSSALHVDSNRIDAEVGIEGAAIAPRGSREAKLLDDWFARQESQQTFLLLEADAEATEWTKRCLRHADAIVIVGNSADDPMPTQVELELIDDIDKLRSVRQILVLLHPPSEEKIEGTARWLDARHVQEHHHVRIGVPKDMERVARVLSGNAIGLVLGGGGARGFAHAGIYRVMCEMDIPIDWVGGSSIGAVFGAGIAMGWEPQMVEDEARHSFVNENPFGDFTIPLVALLRGKRIDRLTRRSFTGEIEDMLIPYFCVSSDLSAASLRVHERGEVWRAIRASVSLPGVLPPAVEARHLAIDGGILNNLPIDIMRERSVGRIIAVDLSAGKEYELDYHEMPGPLQILLSRLPFTRNLQVPGIVTLMMKATVMASAVHSRSVRSEASLVLNPPVGQFGLLAMGDFEEIVEVGYQHGLERLRDWPKEPTGQVGN